MTRRRFLCGLALGTLSAALAAETQPARKIYQIRFLANGNQTTSRPSVEAFRQGLRESGWVEGQTFPPSTDGRTASLIDSPLLRQT